MWAFSICTYFVTYCWEIFDLNEVIIGEVRNYSSKPRFTKEENNKTTYVYHLDYVEVFRRQGPFCNFSMYLAQYLAPITLFVSFISLVFAAADRYVALTFPFRYKQINSIKIAKVASFFIWLFSAIIHTATHFQFHYPHSVLLQPQSVSVMGKYSLNKNITAFVLFVLFSFLWTLTILTLYSLYKIYRKSLSLTKKMKKGFSLEKQMSLILIFMVLGFTFSLFPTIYHNICFYLYDTSYNGVALYDKSFLISVAFLTTNSVWNFVIYNILNKKFRSAFINIFVKCN